MPRKKVASPSQSPQAVIYARVSTKEQEKEGFSIDAQLKLLRDYAATNGFDVLQEYVDVETAKQIGCTNFTAMVGFFKKLKKSKLTKDDRCVILVEKTDRLYRNFKDMVTLSEVDPEIHFVKEHTVISNDSHSHVKLMHDIKVVLAKNFIDNLSEETRKGMQEKAEQGLYPARVPLGYRNVTGSNGKRTMELDPTRALLVQCLFEWYATGRYSIKEITEKMYEEGFRSIHGNKVSRSNIHNMLKTSLYYGEFVGREKLIRALTSPLSRENCLTEYNMCWVKRGSVALVTRNTIGHSKGWYRVGIAGVHTSPNSRRDVTSITTVPGIRGNARRSMSEKRNLPDNSARLSRQSSLMATCYHGSSLRSRKIIRTPSVITTTK